MNKTLLRSAIGGATCVAAVGLTLSAAQPASAAPGDPVTGGTTTVEVPLKTVLGGAASGITVTPLSPASVGYNDTAKALDYYLPVSGGDGSDRAGYGSITHDGRLRIIDAKTKKTVTLTNITFSLETDTLSATPSGSTTPIVIADDRGTQVFTYDAATGRQELTGSDLQVDPAGAAYLDKALKTTAVKGGAHIGTFDTVFYNSQY